MAKRRFHMEAVLVCMLPIMMVTFAHGEDVDAAITDIMADVAHELLELQQRMAPTRDFAEQRIHLGLIARISNSQELLRIRSSKHVVLEVVDRQTVDALLIKAFKKSPSQSA